MTFSFQKYHLQEDEVYLQDFLVSFNDVRGSLKLCTHSLYFEHPDDFIVRLPFASILDFQSSTSSLTMYLKTHVIIKSCSPYKTISQPTTFSITLYLTSSSSLLNLVSKLFSLQKLSYLDRAQAIDQFVEEHLLSKPFDMSLLKSVAETVVFQTLARHLSCVVSNPGHLIFSDSYVYFSEINDISAYPVKYFKYSKLSSVSMRCYNVRFPSIELFFSSSSDCVGFSDYYSPSCTKYSIYFVLDSVESREQIVGILQKFNPEVIINDINLLPKIKYLWSTGAISNFEYLLHCNDLAGRSFKDFARYPVFPWILQDYTSSTLDLEDPKIYRDLSKPVGGLNQSSLSQNQSRYSEMMLNFYDKYKIKPLPGQPLPNLPLEAIHDVPMIFGSHYSTFGFCLYYLVRSIPELVLRFQSGGFDSPDRSFFSIFDSFDHVYRSNTDCKELIPEFYDDSREPEFLTNTLNLNLGVRTDSSIVGDVVLPPWANDSTDFVRKMNQALESRHVSNHINSWIDLVFGFQQKGVAAITASNVFCHLTYADVIPVEKLTSSLEGRSIIQQMIEFGQCPMQLFENPHERRGFVDENSNNSENLNNETVKDKHKDENHNEDDNVMSDDMDSSFMNISNSPQTPNVVDSPELFKMSESVVSSLKSQVNSLFVTSFNQSKIIVSACADGFLRILHCDGSVVSAPLSRLSLTSVKHFRIENDLICVCCSLDNTSFLYSCKENRVVHVLDSFSDAVGCCSICRNQDDDIMLVFGLWNSCIELFCVDFPISAEQVFSISELNDDVTSILIDYVGERQLIVSGSADGTVLFSTVDDPNLATVEMGSDSITCIAKFSNDVFFIGSKVA
ncbi:hypothetical protein GEMRC1_014062 [Eukaryota sp. GEM-RC1]